MKKRGIFFVSSNVKYFFIEKSFILFSKDGREKFISESHTDFFLFLVKWIYIDKVSLIQVPSVNGSILWFLLGRLPNIQGKIIILHIYCGKPANLGLQVDNLLDIFLFHFLIFWNLLVYKIFNWTMPFAYNQELHSPVLVPDAKMTSKTQDK